MRKLVAMAIALLILAGTAATTAQARKEHKVVSRGTLWRWFATPAVQCETKYEGSFTSVGPGYYGKFQMDISFQTETRYGKWAYRRYGTAEKWPPIVQVRHAFEVWMYAGWHRWPPYYRHCYGKWPSSPSSWK